MAPITVLCFVLSSLLRTPFAWSVSISLSPQSLRKSGDPVDIKWSGIESPSDIDWLGIYSPPSSSHDHFIGYVFLSSSPTWETGSGSVHLPLVNLRASYQFRIFRWTHGEVNPKIHDRDHNPLPQTAHLLAQSENLSFEPGGGPEQIHLSYTDNDDEMRVMFVTKDGNENVVKYGLGRNSLTEVAGTETTTYRREMMCDYPANDSIGWRDPGYTHEGVMINLKQGQKHYYKVGNNVGGWSGTYSFTAKAKNTNETIAFLFGDMGVSVPYSTFIRTQEESRSTVKWILRDIEALGDKPAFVSHIGDISYARGYSWIWDAFFHQIEPLAARVPYHVCMGNHEYDWPEQPWKPEWSSTSYGTDGGGECGVPYSLRFHMPGNSSVESGTVAPPTTNLFYSFDMGVVHFVYVSTETDFLRGSKQYEFIKGDLESVDRTRTPFIVVQGHRPMYTTSHELRDANLRGKMVEHLEPLLVKNRVTLALWGHVHRYERFCPMKEFSCGEEGLPVHVVIGMGGQDWQPSWEPRGSHPEDPIFPQPQRSMYRGGEFGYARLVASMEKLVLSYVGNHDGQVHDAVEILSSGEVMDGGGRDVIIPGVKEDIWGWGWYVKSVGVLVVGAFVGYVLGFMSTSKGVTTKQWISLKNEEA